jgi:hypothetical protein
LVATVADQRGAFSAMRLISATPQSRPWSVRRDGIAHSVRPEGRRYRLRVDDLADYLDTFMKRARREAQPKDAKGQKDEAAN